MASKLTIVVRSHGSSDTQSSYTARELQKMAHQATAEGNRARALSGGCKYSRHWVEFLENIGHARLRVEVRLPTGQLDMLGVTL